MPPKIHTKVHTYLHFWGDIIRALTLYQFLSLIYIYLLMCCWLSGEKRASCHCMFPPNQVEMLGGGPVSKATRVSFFASGPFPTCYQMSWSSTAEASKSSSLGAATGAANVRKPNTAARAGRFQLRLRRDGEADKLFSVWFSQRKCKLCLLCFFLFLSSICFQKLQLQLMEARLIHISLSGTFQKFA